MTPWEDCERIFFFFGIQIATLVNMQADNESAE